LIKTVIVFSSLSGLNAIKDEMKSWEWRYGRTPKFNITIKFDEQSVILSVKNGIIENVSTTCAVSFNNFINKKFNVNVVDEIKQLLKVIKI
jgi:hypothetical protein